MHRNNYSNFFSLLTSPLLPKGVVGWWWLEGDAVRIFPPQSIYPRSDFYDDVGIPCCICIVPPSHAVVVFGEGWVPSSFPVVSCMRIVFL